MNAKEYINSGAIETCVLGLADEQDLEMQKQMEKQFPEVKAARIKVEEQLERNAPQLVFATPEKTKQKVQERLQQEMLLVQQQAEAEENASHDLKAAPKPIRWFRTALAASFLLLMGSVLLNFYFFSQYNKATTRYSEMQIQQTALLKKKSAMEATLAMVKNPAMKQVPLATVAQNATTTIATVYWDKSSKDVYLMANNLEAPAIGKQYQLWAQVDGKMVDAGMLTWNDEGLLVKMHNVPQAEAFAISLEKEGGSTNPTLSAVVALGKV
jgi:Anti-sigma-K factor rskA